MFLAAGALDRLYDRSLEISVFGSHPPGDVQFRQDMMDAVVGDWYVEIKGKEGHFRVDYANTFNTSWRIETVILTEDGLVDASIGKELIFLRL